MTFDAGHLVSSPSLYGPFKQEKTNYNFLTYPSDRAAGYGAAEYPRLWGETNTGDADLCLITHGFGGYVGVVKRAILGADGALRAGWWENNGNLQGAPLTVLPKLPTNASVAGGGSTKCVGQCMTSGLWLEGTLPVVSGSSAPAAGLWLQTSEGGWASTVGPQSVFRLGATDANGKPGHASTLDRGDFLKGKSTARWRALVRNSWEGMSIDKRGNTRLKASAMMVRPTLSFGPEQSCMEAVQHKCLLSTQVEWYVEDVLADTVHITSGAATGGFAGIGGATVEAVHRLSLPETTPYTKASSGVLKTDETAPIGVHSVTAFGAIGDGVTLSTVAFRRAAAAAASDRGTLLVPPGRFVTGAL